MARTGAQSRNATILTIFAQRLLSTAPAHRLTSIQSSFSLSLSRLLSCMHLYI